MSTERVYGWAKHPKVPAGQQDPSEVWSLDVENELLQKYPNDKLCLLRPANVYGVGAKPNYNSAVATWMELALSGQDLIVHGDGHLRNFVYIKDLQAVVRSVCLAEETLSPTSRPS
jgi:nucleoside-diphosphate-sugar epimerase